MLLGGNIAHHQQQSHTKNPFYSFLQLALLSLYVLFFCTATEGMRKFLNEF
jgi:hypothetical protein